MMCVRREAVRSSQIEGTEASLVDLLEYEAQLKRAHRRVDVLEIANYVSALRYGLNRVEEFPLSLRLIGNRKSKGPIKVGGKVGNRRFKDPLKGGGKVGCGIWRGKQAASGRGRGRGDSPEVRSRDRSERGRVAPWEVGPEGCSDGR